MAFNVDRTEGRARRWWTAAAVAINLGGAGLVQVRRLPVHQRHQPPQLPGPGHPPSCSRGCCCLPGSRSSPSRPSATWWTSSAASCTRSGCSTSPCTCRSSRTCWPGPSSGLRSSCPRPGSASIPGRSEAGRALWLISRGLFKKVVIASYLATHGADPLFAVPGRHAGIEALFGVYAYAIQIYADFSGYTDIAIGLALLLGIRFPQNFDSPYRSLSLQEFWRRWHMTLSRFLRDYLYIPLGGSRKGPRRTYINLMATMLLGGSVARRLLDLRGVGRLARGRSGLRAGPALAPQPEPVGSGCRRDSAGHGGHPGRCPRSEQRQHGRPGGGCLAAPRARVAPVARVWTSRVAAWAITFNFVCLGWILFRASSVRQRRPGVQADLHRGAARAPESHGCPDRRMRPRRAVDPRPALRRLPAGVRTRGACRPRPSLWRESSWSSTPSARPVSPRSSTSASRPCRR